MLHMICESSSIRTWHKSSLKKKGSKKGDIFISHVMLSRINKRER